MNQIMNYNNDNIICSILFKITKAVQKLSCLKNSKKCQDLFHHMHSVWEGTKYFKALSMLQDF